MKTQINSGTTSKPNTALGIYTIFMVSLSLSYILTTVFQNV